MNDPIWSIKDSTDSHFKVHRVFWLPLVHNKSPTGALLKTAFQTSFGSIPAPYLYTPETTMNKLKKSFTVSKWRPILWAAKGAKRENKLKRVYKLQ